MKRQDIEKYKEQLRDVDITRPFQFHQDEKSLMGFKEIVERGLELSKTKAIFSDDPFLIIEIGLREAVLQYLDDYLSDKLFNRFFYEYQRLKELKNNQTPKL